MWAIAAYAPQAFNRCSPENREAAAALGFPVGWLRRRRSGQVNQVHRGSPGVHGGFFRPPRAYRGVSWGSKPADRADEPGIRLTGRSTGVHRGFIGGSNEPGSPAAAHRDTGATGQGRRHDDEHSFSEGRGGWHDDGTTTTVRISCETCEVRYEIPNLNRSLWISVRTAVGIEVGGGEDHGTTTSEGRGENSGEDGGEDRGGEGQDDGTTMSTRALRAAGEDSGEDRGGGEQDDGTTCCSE